LLSSESLLLLLLAAGAFRALNSPAEKGDVRATVEYCGLVAALSALVWMGQRGLL
jgi:hypothetical protein